MKIKISDIKKIIREEVAKSRTLNENHLPTLVMSKCENEIMALAQAIAVALEQTATNVGNFTGGSADEYLPEVENDVRRCIADLLENYS